MAHLACDVDFIRENCVEDTVTVLADSKLRDRKRYPQPCEYSVKFSEPIKLVYGFQILDATIPSTVYNVDGSTNIVSYTLFSPNFVPVLTNQGMPWLLLAEEFVNCVAWAKNGDSLSIIDVWTLDAKHSNTKQHIIASIGNLEIFSSSAPLDHFDDKNPARLTTRHPFFFKLSVPCVLTGTNADVHCILLEKVASSQGPPRSLYVCQTYLKFLPCDRNTLIYDVDNGCVVWYERYFVRNSLISATYMAALAARDYASISPSISVARITDVTLKQGFYNVDTFLEQFNGMDQEILAANDPNLTLKLTFRRIDRQALFCMNANRTTAKRILGMDNSPHELLVSDPQTFSVVTPGIGNFLVTEYVVLRCKEIEEHVYRDEVAGSAGIGVFKVVDIGQVSSMRFDFISFVRRPFHPIAKLSSLTFRFEHSDGSLCDFNGINNMFIMGIQRYMPRSPKHFTGGFPLNPNYNPDFREYDIGRMALQRSFEMKQDDVIRLGSYDPGDFVKEHNHLASRAPSLRLPEEEDFDDCESDYEDDDADDDAKIYTTMHERVCGPIPDTVDYETEDPAGELDFFV